MKRWLSSLVIFSYITILSSGLVCHALSYRVTDHPLMYFIVWDMFCGWSAYADATRLVAEGESGKFYDLAPSPWGEIVPYGSIGRHHYDIHKNQSSRLAMNTLRHTQHEPITRIFSIEEIWPKKFNLPEPIWMARYGIPKDVHKYYRMRLEMNGEGMAVRAYTAWLDNQSSLSVLDNPRLVAESRNRQSFFIVDQHRSAESVHLSSPKGN